MTISEQAYTDIMQLIQEGESLDASDLEAFYSWVEASYEALEFDPVQQRDLMITAVRRVTTHP